MRLIVSIVIAVFSTVACKTIDRKETSQTAATAALSPLQCLEKLRTFSQGHATALIWPEGTPQAGTKSYAFAIIAAPNADGRDPSLFLEDEQGRIFEVAGSTPLACPQFGDADMMCLRFPLPDLPQVQYAIRMQVFENETVVLLNAPVPTDPNSEIASFPVAHLTLRTDLKGLVQRDVAQRLPTIKDSLAIMTQNLSTEHADAMTAEAEMIASQCLP